MLVAILPSPRFAGSSPHGGEPSGRLPHGREVNKLRKANALMEGLGRPTSFAKLVGRQLQHESFTLIDVGCSGGLDEAWRSFGPKLRAFGFDPNLAECTRLASLEPNPNVRYIPSFVGVPPDHAFTQKKGDRPDFSRNPWERLGVARSLEIIAGNASALSEAERTTFNL